MGIQIGKANVALLMHAWCTRCAGLDEAALWHRVAVYTTHRRLMPADVESRQTREEGKRPVKAS